MVKIIKLEGAYNFRDCGGYVGENGLVVKSGMLYRSDELSHLTNNDLKTMESLNIKTIIDYRGDSERKHNEDIKWKGVKVFYLDPKADVAAMASQDCLKEFDHSQKITADIAKTLMSEQNYQFVVAKSSKKAYKKMLEIIINEKNIPTVQHCRGGKDRTGYGIALILLLLGVSKEDVINDYLMTNICKKEKNDRSLKEAFNQTNDPDFILALTYLKKAREEFLNRALDTIEQLYGTVENYVKKELDFDDIKINKLKQLYLEEKRNG